MSMSQMKWTKDPGQIREMAQEACRAPECTPGKAVCRPANPECAPCFARWAISRVVVVRPVRP